MNFEHLLQEIQLSPKYANQITHIRKFDARSAEYAEPNHPLHPLIKKVLDGKGIHRLYTHQAEAINSIDNGRNPLIVTGTASGKSLAYIISILKLLIEDRKSRILLLFPTKALCQNQFHTFSEMLTGTSFSDVLCGVYDSDTPADMRRRLRDHASVIFTNPDMLHAALMPQHGRWSNFIANIKLVVIDELHTYNGIFGSNAANLFRRFNRLCAHYGSNPQLTACSATIANPLELAERLTEKSMDLIDKDGSPRGKRTYIFWNPPVIRSTIFRSRRSANVEAHELMAMLIQNGAPTITFSKAKMTAEMIYRYVCEELQKSTPQLISRITPYRGGYLPEERREIERKLFNGELLGISSTRALELGIDIGALDASILVGYPGTLASFYQQSGRAGRQDRDSLAILVGLDTSVNQYIMNHPEYIFDRQIEEAVIDPDNPFVIIGHLQCAAQELPIAKSEVHKFGIHADTVLEVLEENLKLKQISETWYHSASEIPQHEVPLRGYSDNNVVIENVTNGMILGEVDKYDASPLLHPGAIYMHLGDTYRILELDLEQAIAKAAPEKVDYYTQPIGGTGVNHIDNQLREKSFGSGRAFWGEVTSVFHTAYYEKIHFYSLDAISIHGVDLPHLTLETMAFWLIPPEDLMAKVMRAGLDAISGLRGIGFAIRMMLPLFITCDTYDFSHSIGSVNAPWNTIFVYERFPHGLGFTAKAYERLHEIIPAVLMNIKSCPCEYGCPCCVGKPLRQETTWNVERGEGSIQSKLAAIMILEGLLGDYSNLNNSDADALSDSDEAVKIRLKSAIRRRLEVNREPKIPHQIRMDIKTEYPEIEKLEKLGEPDTVRRIEHRSSFQKELRKRIADKTEMDNEQQIEESANTADSENIISSGDPLASRAKRIAKKKKSE